MMKRRIVGGVSALAVACAGGALAVSQARSVQTPQRHPASAVAAPPAPFASVLYCVARALNVASA